MVSDSTLSFFHTPYLFAPFGTSLVLHTHTALPAFIGATILKPLPLVVAHNVVLVAGLAANGIAAYALAIHQVHRVLPAMLAGVVFAGSSYISIHLLGHFNLVHAWVIPLAALAWIRCVENPTAAAGAYVGIAFAAAAFTDYYYVTYVLLFALAWLCVRRYPVHLRWARARLPRLDRVVRIGIVILAITVPAIAATGGFRLDFAGIGISVSSVRNPLAALWLLGAVAISFRLRFVPARQDDPVNTRPFRRAMSVATPVFLLLVLPLALPATRILLSGDYVSPALQWRSGPRGVDLLTLVLGNPLHPLYGSLTRSSYERVGIDLMEQVAWFGMVPVVLGVLVCRSRAELERRERAWLWVAGLFFVWSAGAFVNVAGVDTGLPMPQAAARVVPLLSNARMPGRAVIVVQLAIAVLCALYAARRNWRPAHVVLVIALVLLDSVGAPQPTFRVPVDDAVNEQLRKGGDSGVVLELPVGIRDGFGEIGTLDHTILVQQTKHGRPIVGGFVARLSERVKHAYQGEPAIEALMLWPDRDVPVDLNATLRRWNVSYVVVNTDKLASPIGGVLKDRGLRLMTVDGARELYRMP